MNIRSEKELVEYGKKLGQTLKPPATIELIGDVGAGKTTLTRGIAEGLGVKDLVTSPSFTICKRYNFDQGTLAHYDFYRLPDPGLMSEELSETLADPTVVTVIEWGTTIKNLLPDSCLTLTLALLPDGTREILQKP